MKQLLIIAAITVFLLVAWMFVLMPNRSADDAAFSDDDIGGLKGNYTILDDVNGLALVGFKPPYDGAEDDGEAINQYVNTTYYAELGLLDLGQGPESLQMFAIQGEAPKINGEAVEEALRLTRFLQPCYSTKDQKIYQLAHKYVEGAYENQGERVLLSITAEGEYEIYTADLIGTGYIEGYDPFYLSGHRGCAVEIAAKYLEQAGKSCAELELPFSCYERPATGQQMLRFEVQEVDFSEPKIRQLMAWADKKDGWPLELEVINEAGVKRSMTLPRGDFVQESGFFKKMRCFSCGCSCYQHLNMSSINGDYYLIASGWAIDDEVRGIYKLKSEDEWERVLALPATARYFKQVGRCHIAWDNRAGESSPFENEQVSWVDLCPQ